MTESVYKVIELVGTSSESWERAAKAAVERAAETLRDLRIAEVVEQDVQLKDGKVELYRVKVKNLVQIRAWRRLRSTHFIVRSGVWWNGAAAATSGAANPSHPRLSRASRREAARSRQSRR